MPNIHYVCLSDLHLGEEDSLLTNITDEGKTEVSSPSPALVRLVECLAALLRGVSPKPTLILNGDILELALSTVDEAATVFLHFISLVMPKDDPLFGEIVCLPGNHDHHLWENARETQYLNYIGRLPPETPLKPPWHTTKIFMDMQGKDRLAHQFLTSIVQRFDHLKRAGVEILTAYPNYGILGAPGRGCVLFHHGHYVEPLYKLMSKAVSLALSRPEPADVYELEAHNFAWIDFFWSAMGIGEDLEPIYEATHDPGRLAEITDRLARNVARDYDVPYLWPDWTEEHVLKFLLRQLVVKRVAGKQERQQTRHPGEEPALTPAAAEGLRWYLEAPLRKQVEVEHGPMPGPVTFVFGHTHKPFQAARDFGGYAGKVRVLNTGGWIVESIEPEPLRGGAVVLVDDELNAVSLRMYNEGRYSVRVEEVTTGQEHSALWREVNEIVRNDSPPWRPFNETVAAETRRRAELLRDRVEKKA